jgi:hypothetical protein
MECYGRGTHLKPPCQVPECEEKHSESLREILMGASASVSLVTEEDSEEENNAYANVTRAGGKGRKMTEGKIWTIHGWRWRPKRTLKTGSSM